MSSGQPSSARDIVASLQRGDTTAEQVATTCLERISAAEPRVRAWAHLDADAVLEEARSLDRQRADDPSSAGPLHGVPIGVKDIIDVAGMPTGNGADVPVTGPAVIDAEVVASLRAAGALIVGKTVTTEYALFRPGPTTNPHDPTRTPGGSSSGSAAAVAAGTVPLAIATQTAGSVVRPASFCGVVGAKPTFGSVPRDGVMMCSSTLDTVGLIGRDVDDVALGLGVMADDLEGFTPLPATERPRIGFCRTFEWDDIDPAARRVVEAGIERLAAGLDIVEVALPEAMRGLVDAQRSIMGVECADHLAEVRERHADLLSPKLLRVLDEGEALRWSYEAALAHAAVGRSALEDLFAHVDVVIAPSVVGEAPPIESTGDPLLCRMWTLLGTPTVSVPGLTGPSGLPVGVQVIAPRGRDAIALGAAAQVKERLA